MRIAHILRMDAPTSLEGVGGNWQCMVSLAIAQAMLRGNDVWVYGAADSNIIEDAERIANELGIISKTSEDRTHIDFSSEGCIPGRSQSPGSLTFRTTGKTHIYPLPGETFPQPKPEDVRFHQLGLCRLLQTDNLCEPFDIIGCHNVWYQGALKSMLGGGENVILYAHSPIRHDQELSDSGNQVAAQLGVVDPKKGGVWYDSSHAANGAVIAQSPSHAQSYEDAGANVIGCVHSIVDFGQEREVLDWEDTAGYLFSIGRIIPDKGTKRAIEIARRAGKPLILAGGRFDDSDYFDTRIAPHITEYKENCSPEELQAIIAEFRNKKAEGYTGNPPVIYVGELDNVRKQCCYQSADATLFPISIEEAFGRVMTESMAWGTPVIGVERLGDIRCGAVRDVIDNGQTGFKISADNEEEAIAASVTAVGRLREINRQGVRLVYKGRWSVFEALNKTSDLYNEICLENRIQRDANFGKSDLEGYLIIMRAASLAVQLNRTDQQLPKTGQSR